MDTALRRLPLAFGVLLVFLTVNGGISLYNTHALIDYNQQVVESYSVLNMVNGVLIALDDAETGQRGFLLTRQTKYLNPYNDAVRNVGGRLTNLNRLTAHDPIQHTFFTRLRSLTYQKLGELGKTVALQRSGRHRQALQVVLSGRGQRLMHAIRNTVGSMKNRERQLLQRRSAAAENHRRGTTASTVIATLANLGLLAFVFFLSNRAIKAQQRESEERSRLLAREQEARARAETEQRRAASLTAERDEFLSAAAHDLKTPLTTLKGLAQVLKRRVTREGDLDRGQLLDGLKRIDQTATRMTELINELLDVSRMQTGRALVLNLRSVDLADLVPRIVSDHREMVDHHRVQVQVINPRVVGEWDADRLDRVVANLLSNAVKYSPDGGDITVSVREERDGDSGWGVVTVRDEGLGIPAHDLPHVFERFHRGSNVVDRISGTGIGLAGARQIVEQHGGSITVESREGEGSTFSIRLPLAMKEEVTRAGSE